ncbi:MAG: transglycosylase domain-containing protein [Candidatus Peribacteria bacterium]|nr:MAG: transglycosylase domain-containing protein [Candidatus Peribacteria bacterium]
MMRTNAQNMIGLDTQISGASTITQQLVKNVMLSKQKTIQRKLQEIILAQRLTSQRENQVQEQYPDADTGTTKQKTKEAILETYLNYVYYGNHSYGIVGAAENFFHTTPDQLTPLQSAILASLPQSPSRYNPLEHPDTVMGERTLTNTSGNVLTLYPHIDSSWIPTIREQLPQAILMIENQSCLQSIEARASGIDIPGYVVDYHTGRKDRVLCRMYEDGYITASDIRDAIIESTSLTLYRPTTSIKAPHFVFWVQKFLQTAEFLRDYHIDESTLSQAGWTIRTSLDPLDQKIAGEIVADNMKHVYLNGGNNRALIHVDSLNGDVLAYIGSADYYNTEIKGQNDMIQALRQV